MSETPPAPVQGSPAAEQLARGYSWLRFDPALESAFWRGHFEQGVLQLRVNLLLALALLVAFTMMDRTLVPVSDPGRSAILAYAVVLPCLLACLGATVASSTGRASRRAGG